jgi:hypothetical protein
VELLPFTPGRGLELRKPIEQSLDLGVETGSHGFHLGQLRAQMQQPVGAAQWDNRFSATRALTNGSNTSPFGSESDGYRNRSWSADSSLYWAQGRRTGYFCSANSQQ